MKLFKKKPQVISRNEIRTKLASGLTRCYKASQDKWAKWMIRCTARLSRKGWMISLVLFVLLTGGYCTYLIVGTLAGENPKAPFAVTSITKPKSTAITTEVRGKQMRISESEFNKLKQFRYYMDSLSRSPTGKRIYDSIYRRHPGMMDSLVLVEKYYESQSKIE